MLDVAAVQRLSSDGTGTPQPPTFAEDGVRVAAADQAAPRSALADAGNSAVGNGDAHEGGAATAAAAAGAAQQRAGAHAGQLHEDLAGLPAASAQLRSMQSGSLSQSCCCASKQQYRGDALACRKTVV